MSDATRSFVIRDVRLVDGLAAEPRSHTDVLVADGAIREIGERLGGAEITFDGGGHTLLPGLIDCHVHLSLDGAADPAVDEAAPLAVAAWRAATNARRLLEAGFTTVRSMGDRDHLDVRFRDYARRDPALGPRILAAGQLICMTGGHGWTFHAREADGPDDVRKAVREQLKAGADVVKFIATGGVLTPGVEPASAQLTLEELRAGIEEAHRGGRRTAAHAQGLSGIRNAVEAGIDSVEHGTFLDEATSLEMLRRDTALVPTPLAPFQIRRNAAAGVPAYAVAKANAAWDSLQRTLGLARRLGLVVGFGSDAGTPFNPHGTGALGLQLLVEGGFTPLEAIACATVHAAKVLGIDAGVVRAGASADFVLVDGDPTAGIHLLAEPARIAAVFRDGALVAGRWHREPDAASHQPK